MGMGGLLRPREVPEMDRTEEEEEWIGGSKKKNRRDRGSKEEEKNTYLSRTSITWNP